MAGKASQAQRGRSALFGPSVYGLAVLLFRVSLVLAGLAAAYLLWGLFSGQLNSFAALPRAQRLRIFDNLLFAGNALRWSVAAAALLAAYVYYEDEVTGYLIALAGLVFTAGIPYAYSFFTGAVANAATQRALLAFPGAALPLWLFGGILIAWNALSRLAVALQRKALQRDRLQYGGDAQTEHAAPAVAKRFMGKCWQGPYCREFIRVHCPIFQARKACWRVKRGCYCEPDIVNSAVTHISGPRLAMAPRARYNFANDAFPGATRKKTELTYAQKCERCRHCVIYTEHQREKYALLLPITIVGVALLCFLGAPILRQWLGIGLGGLEDLMKRFTFGDVSQGPRFTFRRPEPAVEWALIIAFGVMVLSKALQTLEWAIFKKML